MFKSRWREVTGGSVAVLVLLLGTYLTVDHTPQPTVAASPRIANQPTVPTVSFRVASLNIRTITREANVADEWANGREARVAEFLGTRAPDVIGFQEFEPAHLAALNSTWAHYGSPLSSATNTIAWNKNRFALADAGFAPLPLGWPAADGSSGMFIRGLTWVVLQERSSGTKFMVFNTHLEHRGAELSVAGESFRTTRKRQATALTHWVRDINLNTLPFVFTGDLNSDDLDAPYRALMGSGLFADSLQVADQAANVGVRTFNGFSPAVAGNRIDFVLVSPTVHVTRYEVDTETFSGRYASDHFPVLTQLTLPRQG